MILVDIQAPALDRVFDFELDEDQTVGVLTGDILALLVKREELKGCDEQDMYLYALRQEKVLRREETLKAQGVQSGDRLILV